MNPSPIKMASRSSRCLLHLSSHRTTVHRTVQRLAAAHERRRYVSAYGYTQAKSLIYTKHGEPKDVLE